MIFIADSAALTKLLIVGDRSDMMARAQRVLDENLSSDDPAIQVLDHLRAASRIAITGAGALSSLHSGHIIERWLVGQLAVRAEVPYVMTGQTLGPELSASDAFLLSELLEMAENVWVRDDASFRLADTLGVAYDHLQMTDEGLRAVS